MITFLQLQNKPPKRCFYTLKNHLFIRSLVMTQFLYKSSVPNSTLDWINVINKFSNKSLERIKILNYLYEFVTLNLN